MTKLLVIEDELFVREGITELLEAEDYEVFSTENGVLGVLWAQENLPDLVICDVMMPEIDGHEVLSEMRKLPSLALTPFIFLTAKADKTSIRQGMELGADDYLTKPISRDDLINAIETRLAKHKKIQEQYDKQLKRADEFEQRASELEKLYIQEKLSQNYYEAVLKLAIAINLIEKIQPGELRDRNIDIIRKTCANEIEKIDDQPNLRKSIISKNPEIAMKLLN